LPDNCVYCKQGIPFNAVTDNSIAQEFSDFRESRNFVLPYKKKCLVVAKRNCEEDSEILRRALKKGDKNIIYDIETRADVTQYFRGFYYGDKK